MGLETRQTFLVKGLRLIVISYYEVKASIVMTRNVMMNLALTGA